MLPSIPQHSMGRSVTSLRFSPPFFSPLAPICASCINQQCKKKGDKKADPGGEMFVGGKSFEVSSRKESSANWKREVTL